MQRKTNRTKLPISTLSRARRTSIDKIKKLFKIISDKFGLRSRRKQQQTQQRDARRKYSNQKVDTKKFLDMANEINISRKAKKLFNERLKKINKSMRTRSLTAGPKRLLLHDKPRSPVHVKHASSPVPQRKRLSGNFLNQVHKGVKLKSNKPEQQIKPYAGPKLDFLNQIKGGATLKPVSSTNVKPGRFQANMFRDGRKNLKKPVHTEKRPQQQTGMFNAFADALEKRRAVMKEDSPDNQKRWSLNSWN